MSTYYDPMVRVSAQRLCPVCHKPDWCLVAPDGSAAICQRVESEKQCGGAGWLHKDFHTRPSTPRHFTPKPKSPPRDWSNGLARWEKSPHLEELAAKLGVTRESLERIGTGYDTGFKWWTFPEKDSHGTVIGILKRDHSGIKRRIPNSRCGLCYPNNWDQPPGPILLVEGPSCTAAVLSMGLCGVGRPSNTGGVDHLIGLLDSVPRDREIIVIGERDEKPDGKWPGQDGAVSTANQLSESLDRPIAWSFVPDDKKDTRAWLQSAPKGLPVDRLADLFLSGFNKIWVQPIPLRRSPTPTGPEVTLADWREELSAIRIASLQLPGCYLDASPTGSGKSYADLQALLYALRSEAA